MPDTHDWMVRRTEHGFVYGHDTLIIGRHYGETTEVVQQISASPPLIVSYTRNEALNGEEILRLPLGVLDAIAEAVKPGPSQGEVRRLEEALKIERARVDKALDSAAALPYAGDVSPLDGEAVQSIVLRLADASVRLEWEIDRASDLYLGLDLALGLAQEAYELETRVEAVEPGQISATLSRLVETLKGTLERDARIRRPPAPPVTPKPVTTWQPPAPPEPR